MTELEKLVSLGQAQYDSQRQSFATVLAEESRLRAELARLKELAQAASGAEPALTPLHAVGADILWQSWLTRTRSDLNLRLARTLAIKTHEQSKVKQAFGKVVALQQLASEARETKRKLQAQRRLATAIDQSLLRSVPRSQ